MLSIGATKKGPGGALPPNKKQNGVYKEQNMTKKEQNGAFFWVWHLRKIPSKSKFRS